MDVGEEIKKKLYASNYFSRKPFADMIWVPNPLEKAKNGKTALLFMNGSHFVFGYDFLDHIYSSARRFIETFSGRKCYNVLRALNFVTKKIYTVKNNSYLIAESA